MNLLFITTWDLRGESFNGHRIHDFLNKIGHKSTMGVFIKEGKGYRVYQLGNKITRIIDEKIIPNIERFTGIKCVFPVSGISLLLKKYFWTADVVHIQVFHGISFFSLLLIPIISRFKPVVLTVHDPWITTGRCIYPMDCDKWKTGCGNCFRHDIPIYEQHNPTRFMWIIKYFVFHNSKNLTLVVASNFMHRQVNESPITSNLPCEIIPFGIDTQKFHPMDKSECRTRFLIPKNNYVIAFRYQKNNKILKGFDYIYSALLDLDITTVTLITFDSLGLPDALKKKFQCVELGWIPDQKDLVRAYNAADILLMPSLGEAFGLTAIESMACGTPVIVFKGTALSEIIKNGGIVTAKNSDELSNAIKVLYENLPLKQQLSLNGERIVRDYYPIQEYIQRHLVLYQKLIKNSIS